VLLQGDPEEEKKTTNLLLKTTAADGVSEQQRLTI
jgi:hypothetical protein